MRLIDADKLYGWIKTECNPYGKPTIDFESGNRMLDIIKRMSTAFDKEKVIEKLKSAIGDIHYTEDGSFNGKCIEDFEFIQAKTALEIVEKGGIE